VSEATATALPAPSRTVRIPLRDGVWLAADLYLPPGAGPWPLVLEMTPYGRRGEYGFWDEAPLWMAHGYGFVAVDCRGKGDSSGEFEAFVHDGEDGHDTVEWLAAQPFCDGAVGMRGSSYTGTNPWYTARTGAPHLRAASPSASSIGAFADINWMGGVFSFQHSLGWGSRTREGEANPAILALDWHTLLDRLPVEDMDLLVTGERQTVFRSFADHPHRDEHTRRREFVPEDYTRMTMPTLGFTGWHDSCLAGTLLHFRAAHAAQPGQHHIVVGPWNHATASHGGRLGPGGEPVLQMDDLRIPPHGVVDGFDLVRRFFDQHLRGLPGEPMPAVRLFLTGSNRWVDADAYPPPQARRTRLYLHSDRPANGLHGAGALDWRPAPAEQPPDEYVHDPMAPLPSRLPDRGAPRLLREWPCDLAPLLDRPDVLVYQSPPASAPWTIAGDVAACLWVSTDALDADFICRLEDVDEAGLGIQICSRGGGRIRLRARAGLDADLPPLPPNTPVEVRIELSGVGHTVLRGHRLRLSVCSSAFPEMFPNPGTGELVTKNRALPRVARQRVWHDAAHPSHLELPLLELLDIS
jgi:putative CocE/NonD family hydrolase